jgi:hypothetical protein
MKTSRTVECTTFERPTKLRSTERSNNSITVPDGGYDLEAVADDQTTVTFGSRYRGLLMIAAR